MFFLTLRQPVSSADFTFANSLDRDQDRQNVGPGLNPNCLKETFENVDYKRYHQTTISIGTAVANSEKFRGIRPRMYIEELL